MKQFILLFILSLSFTDHALASVCGNAKNSLQRKQHNANMRCSERATISRLMEKLSDAKTEKSKESIQKQLAKVVFKQQTFCATAKSYRLLAERISDFCKASHSNEKFYCNHGFSLKIKDFQAISRCRRGRVWLDDLGGCYLVDEYRYTSQQDLRDDELDPDGKVLDSEEASYGYHLTMGTEVRNVLTPERCD